VSTFDPVGETMPDGALRKLQFDKLRSLLATLEGLNRFYTAKWQAAGVSLSDVRSLEDLPRLPVTTKEELLRAQQEDPPFGTNATYPESAYVRFHQTSGSKGEPLRVIDTPESWDWWGRCWGHVLSGAGVTAEDRLFIAFSFGPFIGFWAAVEGARQVGALLIPGGGGDSLQRLHLMRELQATALCCTPTYALRLVEVARENGFDLAQIPMRITVHAGEPGANVPATKARISKAWGARCFDHAGASEVGAHSFECEVQPGGVHVIETEFIAEVLDPKGTEPVEPGQMGELVITNLGRPGFPVIRYRTGDLVRLNATPCECGRTFSRLEGGVLGRTDDMVIVRGVNLYPSAIENLVREFEAVDEYRVTVRKEHELATLEIELELASAGEAEHHRRAVERAVLEAFGLRPKVTLAERGSLPRFELKAKRFHVSESAQWPGTGREVEA
jgi:phenylacetate-CoA ligase